MHKSVTGNALALDAAKSQVLARIDQLERPDVHPNYSLEEVLVYIPIIFELAVVVSRQHVQCGVAPGDYGQPLTSYDWMAEHFPDGPIWHGPTMLPVGLVLANCLRPEFIAGVVGDQTGCKQDHWLGLVPFKKNRRTADGMRRFLKPYLEAAKSRIHWVDKPVSIQFAPDQVLDVLSGLRKSSKDPNKVTLDTMAVKLNVELKGLSKDQAKNLVLSKFTELNRDGRVEFPTSKIRSPFMVESMDQYFEDIDDPEALARAWYTCGLLVKDCERENLQSLRVVLLRAYARFMDSNVEVVFAKSQPAPVQQTFARLADKIENVVPGLNDDDAYDEDGDGLDSHDQDGDGLDSHDQDGDGVQFEDLIGDGFHQDCRHDDFAADQEHVGQENADVRFVIVSEKRIPDRHRIAIKCNGSMLVSLITSEVKPVLGIAQDTPCFVSIYDRNDNVWDLVHMNDTVLISRDDPIELMLTQSNAADTSSTVRAYRSNAADTSSSTVRAYRPIHSESHIQPEPSSRVQSESFVQEQLSRSVSMVAASKPRAARGTQGHGELLLVAMERVLVYRDLLSHGFSAAASAERIGASPAALKMHNEWAFLSDAIASRLHEPAISWTAFNDADGNPCQEWRNRWGHLRTGKQSQNALLDVMEPEERIRYAGTSPKQILLDLNK